jgi:hypothetical protein
MSTCNDKHIIAKFNILITMFTVIKLWLHAIKDEPLSLPRWNLKFRVKMSHTNQLVYIDLFWLHIWPLGGESFGFGYHLHCQILAAPPPPQRWWRGLLWACKVIVKNFSTISIINVTPSPSWSRPGSSHEDLSMHASTHVHTHVFSLPFGPEFRPRWWLLYGSRFPVVRQW